MGHTLDSLTDLGLSSTPEVTDPEMYEALLNIHNAIEILLGAADNADALALRLDGSRDLTGNLAVDTGVTIDGRDLSVDGAKLDTLALTYSDAIGVAATETVLSLAIAGFKFLVVDILLTEATTGVLVKLDVVIAYSSTAGVTWGYRYKGALNTYDIDVNVVASSMELTIENTGTKDLAVSFTRIGIV